MSVIVNGGGGRSVDANPTSGSNNPVSSGGVFTALSGKQDTLTAGTGISITNNVISATGGGGTPNNVYTMYQNTSKLTPDIDGYTSYVLKFNMVIGNVSTPYTDINSLIAALGVNNYFLVNNTSIVKDPFSSDIDTHVSPAIAAYRDHYGKCLVLEAHSMHGKYLDNDDDFRKYYFALNYDNVYRLTDSVSSWGNFFVHSFTVDYKDNDEYTKEHTDAYGNMCIGMTEVSSKHGN